MLPGGLGQVDHPIEAREGSQVRLECRAEGIPPPIVRWRSPVSNNFNHIGNSDSRSYVPGKIHFVVITPLLVSALISKKRKKSL